MHRRPSLVEEVEGVRLRDGELVPILTLVEEHGAAADSIDYDDLAAAADGTDSDSDTRLLLQWWRGVRLPLPDPVVPSWK